MGYDLQCHKLEQITVRIKWKGDTKTYIPAKLFEGYPASTTSAIEELSSHSERGDTRIRVVTMGTCMEGGL